MAAAYDPGRWGNFFVLVGTGSAALTGLVFVAISITLRGIATDATHRYRAINMLTGLTAAFLMSALAIMGHQTYRTVGVEWLVVSVVATVINTHGYLQGYRLVGTRYALNPFRIVGGSACYLAQVTGAAMLCGGLGSGLYVTSLAVIANFFFLISGSWILIVSTLHAPD